jgi:DNA-binding MarR family transcriptional regulator
MQDDGLLDLDNQFCFVLYSASRQMVRAYNEALKKLDLTYPQYLVLLVLWQWHREREARPTIKALGERLELDSGTLTPLLRRLESKGLVTRQRQSSDEREVFVRVTRKGAALKRRARQVPLEVGALCPMAFDELWELRSQLNRFRQVKVA